MLVKKMLKKLGYLSMIGLFVVNFLVLTTNDTKALPAGDCGTATGVSVYVDIPTGACMILVHYGNCNPPETHHVADC